MPSRFQFKAYLYIAMSTLIGEYLTTAQFGEINGCVKHQFQIANSKIHLQAEGVHRYEWHTDGK